MPCAKCTASKMQSSRLRAPQISTPTRRQSRFSIAPAASCMHSSPTISKLLALREALMHLQTQGIDVEEALDHLRTDISESLVDPTTGPFAYFDAPSGNGGASWLHSHYRRNGPVI